MGRSTREVVEDHIRLRQEVDLEEDLARNDADDVVVLSHEGVHHGHDGIRKMAAVLDDYLDGANDFDVRVEVDGEVALELWSSDDVHSGADTFVVRDGLIVAQTIWFSMRND